MTIKNLNLREFLTQERAVLMACIGIALCFWVLNRLSNSLRKTLNIQIEYVIPTGKALSAVPPQYAQVSWQGTGWDLLTGRSRDITIFLDNDSTQVLSLRNIITEKFRNEVVTVSPEQIVVHLEEAQKVSVPIEAVAELSFVKGYDLANPIELNPSFVTVEGPHSIVEHLVSMKTDTLRCIRLKDSLFTKIQLQKNPILKTNISEIQAKIIAEQFTEKSLFIPIIVKNAPHSLRIFPNKIKLDCSLALSHYAELGADKFVAEVDLKSVDFKSKNNTVPIVLSQSSNLVRDIKFSPKSVEFYFEK